MNKFLDKLVAAFGLLTYGDSLRTELVVRWQRVMAFIMGVAVVVYVGVGAIFTTSIFHETIFSGLFGVLMGVTALILCRSIVVADLTHGWLSPHYIGRGLVVLVLTASSTLPVTVVIFEEEIEHEIVLQEDSARMAYEKQVPTEGEFKGAPNWRIPRTLLEEAAVFYKMYHEHTEVRWITYAVFMILFQIGGDLLWILKILAKGDFADYYSAEEQNRFGTAHSQGPRET